MECMCAKLPTASTKQEHTLLLPIPSPSKFLVNNNFHNTSILFVLSPQRCHQLLGVSSISYTAVSVYLSWSAPAFIGNSAILGYKVYQRAVDSDSTPTQLPGAGQYTTTATMINITANIAPYTRYEFAVEACNTIGCSSNRLMYSPFRTSPAGECNIVLFA